MDEIEIDLTQNGSHTDELLVARVTSLFPTKKLSNADKPEPEPVEQASATKPRIWSQVLAILPMYLLQFSYGMNSGFPSILTPQLREDCSEFRITEDQESWIVSIENIATPIVCIISGFLQQKIGPLRVVMLSCIPYCMGWVATALAQNYLHVYMARIMVGTSHGLLTTSVYSIEISSNDLRGTFGILEGVLRCAGQVLVYSLGYAFRWKTIAYFSAVIPIAAFFLCFIVPESPIFLVSKGNDEEAKNSLQRLYGPMYPTDREIDLINNNIDSINKSRERKSDYLHNISKHPEIYKPFFIVICLSFVQQFSGASIVRAYVVKIFGEIFKHGTTDNINATNVSIIPRFTNETIIHNLTNVSIIPRFTNETIIHNLTNGSLIDNQTHICLSGESTPGMAYVSAIFVGLFRLTASLTLARLLLKFKRRTMYFISISATIFCLISFSSFSYVHQVLEEEHVSSKLINIAKYGSLASTCLLVFAVQLGVQNLPFLLSGELFPADVRATCKGLTRAVTCIFIVISLKCFPILENYFHLYGTFFLFSSILFMFIPIMYIILPETKDLGLELVKYYFTPVVTVWYIK